MRKPTIKLDLPETSGLEAFLAIVEHGSFAGAAGALSLPRATVSRRLQRLEGRMGVRLFRRTTRQVSLTQAGYALDPHARRILAATAEAVDAMQQAEGPLRGLLRMSLPPGDLPGLNDAILDFLDANPYVRVEVERSTRRVDLVASGFDIALRAGAELEPGLIARKLVRVVLRAWASPSYRDAHGLPKTLEGLAEHACLAGYERGERPAVRWPLVDGGWVSIQPRLACNEISMLADATARGQGIALLPEPFARQRDLVPVLPTRLGANSSLALVYADRHTSPSVKAFVDHLMGCADTLLLPPAVRSE